MRLLDLFCGAGGAAMGYHRAGFEVVGVDIHLQRHYPFEFHQRGGLEVLEWFLTFRGNPKISDWPFGGRFDAIHASPPCQGYSIAANNGSGRWAAKLVTATLELLRQTGLPWVCENVPGAPLPSAVELCGASFGLGASGMDLPRHRWFELSFPMLVPPCQHEPGNTLGVYGHGTNSWHREKLGRNLTVAEMREAMGMDWTTRDELAEAIPPAFTQYIGEALLEHIGVAA